MSVIDAGGISMRLTAAPPVYAPGGPVALTLQLPEDMTAGTLTMAETAAIEQDAVLMVVQCLVKEELALALLLENGYAFASSWYFGPLIGVTPYPENLHSPVQIRTATVSDVPAILEIGERKREQYETYSPIFWKKSPAPRQEFAPYMTGQVESANNIALAAVAGGQLRGYLIAQCQNLEEGYVDDYAVANPTANWSEVGSPLLTVAGRIAQERNISTFAIVTGHADITKRNVVEEAGFTLQKNWLVKPLIP